MELLVSLLLPIIYAAAYCYRGQTLPKVPYPKGLRLPIAYGVMAAAIAYTLGDWWALPVLFAAQWLAYQPAPDMFMNLQNAYYGNKGVFKFLPPATYRFLSHPIANSFILHIGTNGMVNKFYGRNMLVRHAYSGLVLALAGLYWTPLSLLLIPAHIIGAAGYFRKDNLLFAEIVLGFTVGTCLCLMTFLYS